MRIALLFSCVVVSVAAASAQTKGTTPAQPAPGTGQTRPPATTPAQPRPPATTQPRRAPTGARAGMAITATGMNGATLPGVRIEAAGPTERSGTTNGSGQLNLTGLLAGTYRLRFSGEEVTTFEREVTLRAGQVADIDVSLNPAPAPPPAPEPPPQPEPEATPSVPTGPKGQPLTIGIVELLEKEFVKREPRRETLLACSGSERTTMIQLNDPMPQRLYDSSDVVYYVLGGEGNVVMDGRTTRIATNGFLSVPRGTAHSFDRRGTRPLVLLAVLSGEPCEKAK